MIIHIPHRQHHGQSRKDRAHHWYPFAFVLAAILLPIGALGQMTNPTGPPPSGQTVFPLDTSDRVQRKFGSLVIGDRSKPGTKLCLNAPSSVTDPATFNNTAYCIQNWTDLISVVSGVFVNLRSNTISGSPGDVNNYGTPQRGFIRLKGNQNAYGPTIQTEANSSLAGSTALLADGLDYYNYAGYFLGRLAIEPTGTSSGSLCLNNTGNDGQGHYCIAHWSDIAPAPLTNKLTLRAPSNTTPTAEAGTLFLQQAYNAASFTIGDPLNLAVALKCGDGQCSNYGPTPETPVNCSIDCATIVTATTFTATAGVGQVSLRAVAGIQGSDPLVYLLLVRSTNASMNFQPVNGMSYAPGGNNSLFVVSSGTIAPGGTRDVVDTGLSAGTTYYYRAYQGNIYPRYTPSNSTPGYKSAAATPTSGGGGGCGTCGGGDDPPILPPGHGGG